MKKKYEYMHNDLFIKEEIPQIENLDVDKITMREVNPETAIEIMVQNHYSGTAPQPQVSLGFYIDDDKFSLGTELSTVIMFSTGANRFAANSIIEGATQNDMYELVRLFSYDWAPKNIESYCIGWAFKWLKENRPEKKFLLSYADLNVGHVGIIYQATNFLYTGLGAKGKSKVWLVDGEPKHTRSIWAEVGSNRTDFVKKFYGDRLEIKIIDVKPKARYVYFLCDKREKRKLMGKMKVPVYNGRYPKSYEEALAMEEEKKQG